MVLYRFVDLLPFASQFHAKSQQNIETTDFEPLTTTYYPEDNENGLPSVKLSVVFLLNSAPL